MTTEAALAAVGLLVAVLLFLSALGLGWIVWDALVSAILAIKDTDESQET